MALFSPGWRPPEFQAGGRVFSRRAGLGGQRDHPLAGECFGEPVRVALGDYLRNAKLQLTAVLAPEAEIPNGAAEQLEGGSRSC